MLKWVNFRLSHKAAATQSYLVNDKVKDRINIFDAWNQNSTSILTIKFYMVALFFRFSLVCNPLDGSSFLGGHNFKFSYGESENKHICMLCGCVVMWHSAFSSHITTCVEPIEKVIFSRYFFLGHISANLKLQHFQRTCEKRHMWHNFAMAFAP